MTYKLTPLGILATIVLTIPGLLVGGIVAFVYRMLLGPAFYGNLINWISGGWFETLTMAIFPNVIHGVVGGGLAVWVSFKILKRVNYEVVAYSVSTIIIAFAAIALLIGILDEGLNVRLIELVANTVGIVFGLFAGREYIKEAQRLVLSQAAPINA